MWLYWLKGLFDKKSMNTDEKKKISKIKLKIKLKPPNIGCFRRCFFMRK